MDVVKAVGKYLSTPVGTICYNTDKVCISFFYRIIIRFEEVT